MSYGSFETSLEGMTGQNVIPRANRCPFRRRELRSSSLESPSTKRGRIKLQREREWIYKRWVADLRDQHTNRTYPHVYKMYCMWTVQGIIRSHSECRRKSKDKTYNVLDVQQSLGFLVIRGRTKSAKTKFGG